VALPVYFAPHLVTADDRLMYTRFQAKRKNSKRPAMMAAGCGCGVR